MSDIYGALRGRGDVQQAVIALLEARLLEYLAEVERQDGLDARTITPPGGQWPPLPGSFRPGLDFETWQGEQLPLLIVTCQPVADGAERADPGLYQQWFDVQVAAVIEDAGGDESAAQQTADRYGKAIMGLLTQCGSLGGLAQRTVLTAAPRTEFLDPTSRRFARSVTDARTIIELVDGGKGRSHSPDDPYGPPGEWAIANPVELLLLEASTGTQPDQSAVTSTAKFGPDGALTVTRP